MLNLLLFLVMFVSADLEAMDVTKPTKFQNKALGSFLDIWHNQGDPAVESDVLAGNMSEKFTRAERDFPGIGFAKGELWGRLTLSNPSDKAVELWLESRATLIDQVTFFKSDGQGQYTKHQQGDKVDFQNREIPYRMPAFAFTVPPGEHTFYIRTSTAGSNMLALFLWQPAAFAVHHWWDTALVSGMLGVLMALFLYNGFLALSIRSKTYHYYTLFLAFMIPMQLFMVGVPTVVLDSKVGTWLMNEGFLYASNLTGISAILVTQSFLSMKEYMPRWYTFTRLLILLPAVNMLVGIFVSYNVFASLSTLFSAVYCSALLLASFIAISRGYGPARFFALAWFFILGATVLNSLHFGGSLHPAFIVQFNSLPGAVLEGILMSLALADRVKFLRDKSENTIRDLNSKLSAHVSIVEKIVEERTLTIRNILDHVHTGLFLVGPDGKVLGGYSRSCRTLLERDSLEGQTICEIFAMKDREAAHMRLSIEQIFAELMPFDVCLRELPSTFKVKRRLLKLLANPIRSSTGEIQHLLFTIEDITELRRRQIESRRNQLLIRILSDLSAFRQFVANSFDNLRTMKAGADRASMKFMLHTLKGNSRTFRLFRLAQRIHRLEEHPNISLHDLDRIEQDLAGFLKKYEKILKVSWETQKEDLNFSREKAQELIRLVDQSGNQDLLLKVQRWFEEISQPSMGTLIQPMIANCKATARRLGKEVKFQVQGEQIRLHSALETPIIEGLIHLLRNAVIHGIELDREILGKSKWGTIQLLFAHEGDQLHIQVKDDGRGFSLQEWRKAACHRLSLSAAQAETLSLQELVFQTSQQGFSTSERATLDAGRGIGLGGLISLIREHQGRIELRSEEGKGACFDLWLPRRTATSSQTPDLPKITAA
jgi:signal transduction histidine kinase